MSGTGTAGAQFMSDLRDRIEAEDRGRPFLVFRDRDGGQQLFVLNPDVRSATVGRAPSCHVALAWDDQVSRVHARFERAGSEWALVDDGPSRNGTFVNDQRVRGRVVLADGDRVRFGRTTVMFRRPARREPGARNVAPAAAVAPPSSTQRRVLVALSRPYRDADGLGRTATDEQIAAELFLPVGTVRAHLEILCAKLGVERPAEDQARVRLVERAFTAGLITERDL